MNKSGQKQRDNSKIDTQEHLNVDCTLAECTGSFLRQSTLIRNYNVTHNARFLFGCHRDACST